MDGKRWVTLSDGRRVLINDYMNDLIRSSYSLIKNKNQPKKLSELEYERLCEEFEENLTEEEKKMINLYSTNSSFAGSLYANQITNKDPNKWYYYVIKENGKEKETYLNMNDIYEMQDFYTDINSKSQYEWAQMMQRDQRRFDKLFNEKGISLDKDIVVYRKGHETLEDLQNGVIRYGYTSTSAKSRINKQTPGGLKLGNNEFEIIVPKGMKFLPIKNLVADDIKSQHEILLPRKLQYELISNSSTPADWKISSTSKMRWQPQKNKFVVRVKQV